MRLELLSPIEGDCRWDAKAGYPTGQQSRGGAGLSSSDGHWNRYLLVSVYIDPRM